MQKRCHDEAPFTENVGPTCTLIAADIWSGAVMRPMRGKSRSFSSDSIIDSALGTFVTGRQFARSRGSPALKRSTMYMYPVCIMSETRLSRKHVANTRAISGAHVSGKCFTAVYLHAYDRWVR